MYKVKSYQITDIVLTKAHMAFNKRVKLQQIYISLFRPQRSKYTLNVHFICRAYVKCIL